MSRHGKWSGKVAPAQLSFLAIFNPSIGADEDTLTGEIVFWHSKHDKKHNNKKSEETLDHESPSNEEENERQRQVGLAQGIVNFARTFSNGKPVDSIETEKHRIVLTELEPSWWILASIELTRLPVPLAVQSDNQLAEPLSSFEYSSREISPPSLLLQQLRRANSIFLLHHSSSLNSLWARQPREKFCEILNIFWKNFAQHWDVLLHGNPAVDIFNGTKLAGGGELGVGVGEEEWGSGEREVLEGLIMNTEGLNDVVVSRFGDPVPTNAMDPRSLSATSSLTDNALNTLPWIGTGFPPDPADGVVFSGIGRISRQSLRDISGWTEWIFAHGEDAYAVRHNAKSGRAKRRRKIPPIVGSEIPKPQIIERRPEANTIGDERQSETSNLEIESHRAPSYEVPVPPVSNASDYGDSAAISKPKSLENSAVEPQISTYHITDSFPKSEQMIKFLTLGYGTVWKGFGKKSTSGNSGSNLNEARSQYSPISDEIEQEWENNDRQVAADPKHDSIDNSMKIMPSAGHFIIGLKGDLDSLLIDADKNTSMDASVAEDQEWNTSPDVRTVHVQFSNDVVVQEKYDEEDGFSENGSIRSLKSNSSQFSRPSKRLRVVVYAHRPFIFTFLFDPNTFSLTAPSFYVNLHLHLRPLHKQLLVSTSPTNVAARLKTALDPHSPPRVKIDRSSSSSIFDLIYDATTLIIHSSISNIPTLGTLAAGGLGATSWTRAEALSVHSQILNTYTDTRGYQDDLERTGKTRHGWWIVWMDLSTRMTENQEISNHREAFLIRRASEYQLTHHSESNAILKAREANSVITGIGSAGWGPVRLAEGIGVDARKYVESLLSLAR